MRTIIRSTLALTAAAALCLPIAAAHAAQPSSTPFDYSDTFTADPGDLCDFAVDFTFHDVGWETVTGTGTGAVVIDHTTETDRMSAFGRSITGLPYTYTVQGTLDADQHVVGLHVQGVSWSFLLPDGTRVHAAGYTDWLDQVVHGDLVDLAPVCAYLAG